MLKTLKKIRFCADSESLQYLDYLVSMKKYANRSEAIRMFVHLQKGMDETYIKTKIRVHVGRKKLMPPLKQYFSENISQK